MLNQRIASGIAAALFALPLLATAQQDLESDRDRRWLQPPDHRRAYVKVTNDWRDTIRLTMWTKRGTQIGDAWTIRPGQDGYLREGGKRITALPEYSLRVGNDPGATYVETVGKRRGDTWYISVRDVWRATHQEGGYPGRGRGGNEIEQDPPRGYQPPPAGYPQPGGRW